MCFRLEKSVFILIFIFIMGFCTWYLKREQEIKYDSKIRVSPHPKVTKVLGQEIKRDNSVTNPTCQTPHDFPNIIEEQKKRQNRIEEFCSRMSNSSTQTLRHLDLRNLIVDDTNKVIYCYIPKVACSSWKALFAVLSGRSNFTYEDLSDPAKETDIKIKVHDYRYFYGKLGFRSLGSMSEYDIKIRLNKYFKFLFVRDPLERLVSVWKDKFVNHKGYKISYRPFMPSKSRNITFETFIDFVTGPNPFPLGLEEHWQTYRSLCHPCAIKYDFVGHMDTLRADAQFVINNIVKEKHLNCLPTLPRLNMGKSGPSQRFSIDRSKFEKVFYDDIHLFGSIVTFKPHS